MNNFTLIKIVRVWEQLSWRQRSHILLLVYRAEFRLAWRRFAARLSNLRGD